MRPRRGAAYAWPIAFMVALALVDALELTRDPDVFWHLRVGRTVWETHSSLPRDIFSFSFDGPWRYKDLVSDVLLYLGFARLGYAWFLALKVAAVAAFAGSCHAIVRPRDRYPLVLLLCTGILVDSFWLVERPNLFSMALFAVVVALIERARRFIHEDSWREVARALAPIVLLDFVWSFLHTFALLGYLLVLGLAGTLVVARLAPQTPRMRALLGPRPSRAFVQGSLVAAVAGPLLGLLNPRGIDMWRGVFGFAASPEIRSLILEWKRLGPVDLARAFPIAVASICVAVIALVLRIGAAVRAREEDAPVNAGQAAALVAVSAMAMSTVRWLPFAAILAPLYLAMVLGDAVTRRGSERIPRGASVLLGVLLLVLLRVRQGDVPLGVGEDPDWSPRGAVQFASARGLRGRAANSMELGGYLIFSSWPEVQDLVDGRLLDVNFDIRCLLAEHDAPTFLAMRDGDGATWALAVNRPEQVAYGFLARDPRWALVYWSETAAIYARRDAHPELAGEVFHVVDPYDVPGSVAHALALAGGSPEKVAAILAEVRRMLDVSPDSVRANLAFAAVLAALGPSHHADLDKLLARLLLLTHDSKEMTAFTRSLAAAAPR